MKKRNSYAWIIVIACFLMMFSLVGIVVNCASIFLKPVSDALNFSRTGFSLCFTIVTLSMIVGSLIVGKLLGKINIRVIMTVSVVLASAGYIGYSFCTSLTLFYLASVLIGFGAAGATVIPCSVMLTNWFVEKRGMAMGIAFTGSGFGGMIFAQIANWAIQSAGWERGYLILGICMAAISIPTALFLVRLSPAEKNTVPYGASNGSSQANAATGISAKAFFKSKAFFMLALSVFLVGIINLGVQSHIPAHLTDNGLSPTFATSMITVYMGVLIIGKLILGTLFDKKGPVFGTAYASVVYVLAIAALLAAKTPAVAILFACLFGLCNAMATVSNPFITSNIVGTKDYASIYAVINLFFNVGMAIGAPLSGAIYDIQGKYDMAFIIYAILAVVLTVGVSFSVKLGSNYSTIEENIII